jgi:hypothetical protein
MADWIQVGAVAIVVALSFIVLAAVATEATGWQKEARRKNVNKPD